jgi:hypothetical protein
VGYEWERDFPLFARDRKGAQKSTTVTLEFELTDAEQVDFRSATGINTNQRLPIRVTLHEQGVALSVPKQGRGQHGDRAREISRFVSERVALLHIPAVRPGSIALSIADQILQQRRRALSRTPEYQDLLDRFRELDQTAVSEVEDLLRQTLGRFVPGVQAFELQVRGLERSGGLDDILIDDGVKTSIAAKGDGIQSLVALALTLEWTNARSHPDKQLIVAVEEPESHLHPGAVHELQQVLRKIAATQQVIVTTHSQALVNRRDLEQNVIVSDRAARPARSIEELRATLGVRLSDALAAAEVTVIVEGYLDEQLLPALLAQREPRLGDWVAAGHVIFEGAGSGSKISMRVLAARTILTRPVVVLDSDPAGISDLQGMIDDGVLDPTSVVQVVRPGWNHSELEDMLLQGVYLEVLNATLGFSLSQREAGRLDKERTSAWSERLESILGSRGVPRPSAMVRRCKHAVVMEAVAAIERGEQVLRPESEPLIDRLVQLVTPESRRT